jgi:ADP-ribose pyrophosphatase YjhB (NUDIX family)
MVVGCIPEWNGKIMLCRRAIHPGYGRWTLPAGYLEDGETVYQGTEREALEEAGARVTDLKPFALLNLSFISQVYFMSRARLLDRDFSPGFESLEVQLFREAEIPWDEIAFPVILETLRLYFADLTVGTFPFHVKDLPPRIVR